ncbi:MAG: hypothetical protein JO312_07260, partial [Hyphomicrobiales bacterium]|nr:hypothetical protein [Hyphomicrobiales bacterium]
MTHLSRRSLMKATGAFGATMLPTGLALEADMCRGDTAKAAPAPSPGSFSKYRADVTRVTELTAYIFFNSEEAAFVEAAVARLIPADQDWP